MYLCICECVCVWARENTSLLSSAWLITLTLDSMTGLMGSVFLSGRPVRWTQKLLKNLHLWELKVIKAIQTKPVRTYRLIDFTIWFDLSETEYSAGTGFCVIHQNLIGIWNVSYGNIDNIFHHPHSLCYIFVAFSLEFFQNIFFLFCFFLFVIIVYYTTQYFSIFFIIFPNIFLRKINVSVLNFNHFFFFFLRITINIE